MIDYKTFELTSSPFPGLRSFQSEEAHIFFGREEQTDELLRKLSNSKFLAVVGTSGCGKSSLVKAGMIPALKAGYLYEAGSVWKTAVIRPGKTPFARLADALIPHLFLDDNLKDQSVGFLEAALKRGPLGLIEVFKGAALPPHTNLLLLVDQFEEIFRFRKENNPDEADAFVSLLLATAFQTDLPVYVVITMRSDFLGDCSLFPGLPEALNQCQFLTPKLTREQCKAAIIKPVKVCMGKIDPALTNQLLNDIGSDNDQLPLLQHTLMRMWKHKKNELASQNKAEEEVMITEGDYKVVGGLSNALSNHLDEVYDKLNPNQQKIAEGLFRCLTDVSKQRNIRRPAPLKEISETIGAPEAEVIKVVEEFRKTSRSFLMPPPEAKLNADTYIDITHESIMRQWGRLKVWMQKEQDSARNYRWLSHSVSDKRRPIGGIDLKTATEWLQNQKPNKPWSERYSNNFNEVLEYIEFSKKESAKRNLKRISIVVISILAAAFTILSIGFWSIDSTKELMKSKFYRSAVLDSAMRENALTYLSGNMYYGYKNALASVNGSVDALEFVDSDPKKAFIIADSAWKLSKNNITKKIVLDFVNKNIFYDQEIYTNYQYRYLNPQNIAVSMDGSEFVIYGNKDMIKGYYRNDSLIIDDDFNIKYKSDFSPSFLLVNEDTGTLLGPVSINKNAITFINNNNLCRWKDNQYTKIMSLPKKDSLVYALSQDGKSLAFGINNYIVVCDIDKYERNKNDAILTFPGEEKKISSMAFSPLNNEIIIGYADGSGLIKALDKNLSFAFNCNVDTSSLLDSKKTAKYENMDAVKLISCSANGERFLTITSSGSVALWDIKNKKSNSNDLQSYRINSDGLSDVKFGKLSPDGNRFILTSKEREVFYYQMNNGKVNVIRKITGSSAIASFIGHDSFVSVGDYGQVRTGKVHPDFNDPTKAFSTIKHPPVSVIDKLQDGSLTYEDLILSNNKGDLETAVHFYLLEYNNGKYSGIYKKLIKEADPVNKAKYLNQLILIDRDIAYEEMARDSVDYVEITEKYKQIILNEKALLSIYPSNKFVKNNLAENYGTLAWYLLFTKDFVGAYKAAETGFKFEANLEWIYTNLALGYLLSGRYAEAEKIYKTYKDKTIKVYWAEDRMFRDVFLKDFKDLEDAGVISPENKNNVEKIRKLLAPQQRIRQDLKFIITSQNDVNR